MRNCLLFVSHTHFIFYFVITPFPHIIYTTRLYSLTGFQGSKIQSCAFRKTRVAYFMKYLCNYTRQWALVLPAVSWERSLSWYFSSSAYMRCFHNPTSAIGTRSGILIGWQACMICVEVKLHPINFLRLSKLRLRTSFFLSESPISFGAIRRPGGVIQNE